MKLLCLLIVVALAGFVRCAERSPDAVLDELATRKIQAALDRIPTDQIPDVFKFAKNDNTHWCCKVDMPVMTLDQTRLVSFSYINSNKYRCGYTSCGFLGWSSCTVWCTQTWIEIGYHTDVYQLTQAQACPENQLICCSDYFNIMGHCFHVTEVQQNLELLTILNQQGIVVPPLIG